MKRSKKDVLSATKPLTPYMVVDTKTGETLEYEQFVEECLTPLVSYVHAETVRLYKENKEKVDALSGEQYLFAAKHAEQNGLKGDALNLPREVKAKSRINHLIGAKLISETAAYTKNPNKNKQPHRFNKNLTLGVVDSHMARLGREGNDLILTFRCWTRTVEMRFCMPTYLTRRNITGFTLPTIVRAGFVFVTVERPQSRTGTLTAGLDLGRKEPFTLAVVNEAGKPVAQYTARPIVKAANNKRERILKEIPHLRRKITAYKALGLSTKTLETEVTRMRSKAERMGGEPSKTRSLPTRFGRSPVTVWLSSTLKTSRG